MDQEAGRVRTEEIPQANSLSSLRALVEAISTGAETISAIEVATRLKSRHVRYYLLAAQTLGWIELGLARPTLTRSGHGLLRIPPRTQEESDVIASAILNSPVLAVAAGSFLSDTSLDLKTLTERLASRARLSVSTAKRRAACLLAWKSQLLDRGWMAERMQASPVESMAVPSIPDLSVRAQGVLRRLHIEKAEALAGLSVMDLLKAKNCGRKTTREIVGWAAELGVSIGDEAPRANDPLNVSGPLPGHSHRIETAEDLPTELLLRISDFNVSVRASRFLAAQGIERLGDLATSSESDLLRGKNCGRKTIRELKATLTKFGFSFGMRIPIWQMVDHTALSKQHGAALKVILRRLHRQIYGVDSGHGLETEIASALANLAKASDRPKIELWIGIDQATPPTLQDVGDVAGVTRERIRQIVLRVRQRVRAAHLEMRKLRGAIRRLENAGPQSERIVAAMLTNEGLAETHVSVRGLLRAAELFGIRTKLDFEQIGNCVFVGTIKELAILKLTRRVGRRAVERWGCSTLEDVAAEVSSRSKLVIASELVRDVLSLQPGFQWLDEESGWFWLEEVPRNRLVNKIDKILSVASQVDIPALRAGVARHYRMEGFSPPTRVLRALCSQLRDCAVNGQIVVDKRPRSPVEELSAHEQATLQVFREYGPVLSYGDARQRCSDAGLNETTTTIYLANSPILRRVALGVYTLVGAAISPGEVQAVAKNRSRGRKSRVTQDYGWGPNGAIIWTTYKISEGMLRSGVASVPAAIRKYLTESRYDLLGPDGVQIGQVGLGDVSMWGFIPFFRRRGGEPGDYMQVRFNLADAAATVEISEEPFEETDAA